MSISSYAVLKNKLDAPYRRMNETKVALSSTAGRLVSFWRSTPDGATSNPTTAEACTSTTVGALGQPNSNTTLRLAQLNLSTAQLGCVIIADRLSHQGGLSGVATSAQTTNLPTAALTRYTDGVGVMAGIEIYTQIGTTATTVSASYTNQAGSGSRTTNSAVIGGTGFREVGRVITLTPEGGDTGFQAVASVTVAVSTGTAGAIGVTLFKPLICVPVIMFNEPSEFNALLDLGGFLPTVENNACLFYLMSTNTTQTGILQSTFSFIED